MFHLGTLYNTPNMTWELVYNTTWEPVYVCIYNTGKNHMIP